MVTHSLKTLPEYYQAVRSGKKTFEIRENDRGFAVGDSLMLREWDPSRAAYTGRRLTVTVTYLTDFEQKPGFVVLGIRMSKQRVSELLDLIYARHGMSIVQVADLLNVSLETVNRWRTGESSVSHMTGILLYIVAHADADMLRKALDE